MSVPRTSFFVLLLACAFPACGGVEDATVPRETNRGVALFPAGAREAEAETIGFPVRFENALGMHFELIPTGHFRMGSPLEERGRDPGEAPHEIGMVTPFYVQTTEVTNAWFRLWRSWHDSGRTSAGADLDGDDQPVVGVTHQEAERFALWLSERDPRWTYRLPTEAEWEYACRAGADTAFSFGDGPARAHANFAGSREVLATAPVASYAPNAWGLYDLHGNAAEWCQDRFAPYPVWRLDNPQGPLEGDERIVRGGSWASSPRRGRCAHRAHLLPGHRGPQVGFRLVALVGYGNEQYGAHAVTFVTIDPSATEGEERSRPGWPLRMISVVKRLTDRQIGLRPIWRELDGVTPVSLRLRPGRYYVYCYRRDGAVEIRGEEVKFDIPRDAPLIEAPVPLQEQRGSNRR
ncbi:MAG: formylglycine-generating enzyme family protein [Planctomycetota bacterium]|jgi:formylglycine-generating enzyme required for sulfatase activity